MSRQVRVIPERWRVTIEDDNQVRVLGPGEHPEEGATVFVLTKLPLDVKQRFIYGVVRANQEQQDRALLEAASHVIADVENLYDETGKVIPYNKDMVLSGCFTLVDIDMLVSWVLQKDVPTMEAASKKNDSSESTQGTTPSSGTPGKAPETASSVSTFEKRPETKQRARTTAETAS